MKHSPIIIAVTLILLICVPFVLEQNVEERVVYVQSVKQDSIQYVWLVKENSFIPNKSPNNVKLYVYYKIHIKGYFSKKIIAVQEVNKVLVWPRYE